MRPWTGSLAVFIIMSSLPFLVNVQAEEQAALQLPRPDSRPASLPVQNPTKSFWIDSPDANPLAKEGSTGALTEDSDVCIIGSGITGVSAAYHIARLLAERGSSSHPLNVTILEARDFCEYMAGLRDMACADIVRMSRFRSDRYLP